MLSGASEELLLLLDELEEVESPLDELIGEEEITPPVDELTGDVGVDVLEDVPLPVLQPVKAAMTGSNTKSLDFFIYLSFYRILINYKIRI